MHAPQVVTGKLEFCRRLERLNTDALWVHTLQHLADRTVLATSIHRLQDDQEFVFVFSVESRLLLDKFLPQILEFTLRLLAVVVEVFSVRRQVANVDRFTGSKLM